MGMTDFFHFAKCFMLSCLTTTITVVVLEGKVE